MIVACLNEPTGDFRNDADFRQRFVDWCVGVVDAARGVMNVALPNWSTGNPHESAIISGGFDDLIRAIATATHAWFSAHEYWHDDPVSEYPYTIGRNTFWSDRAALLGLPRLKLLLTEYGIDKGGGGGDGWRNQGLSDEAYADALKRSRTVQPNKPPVAVYCFGTGYGWDSFNIAGSRVPELLKDYQEALPMPPAPTPPPELPIGSNPVDAVVAIAVNLRPAATTNSMPIRTLTVGERVVVLLEPQTTADGYNWLRVNTSNGDGWAVQYYDNRDVFLPYQSPTPEAWTVKLDVPYVSQRGIDAALSANDCLCASLLMCARYAVHRDYGLVPSLPTVDDLTQHSRLAQPDPPHGLRLDTDGVQLANALGFRAAYVQPMTEGLIVSYLSGGTPVIVLLDYSVYNPTGAHIAHILVVSGYSDTEFMTLDPYLRGANVAISRTKLMQAMASSPGNSVGYQGMFLAV